MSSPEEIIGTDPDLPAILGGSPVRTEKFSPRWNFGDEEKAQLMEVMDRAPRTWRDGFKIREFVKGVQRLYGVKSVIATNSGTAAVHAALGGLNPDPGMEVITTPVTDIGTLIGILQHNLIPVFADWDAHSFNTDPADIERKITDRTCAILVVHLFGNPCDMARIMEIARRRNIPVIEDCAQAHLATVGGKTVGAIGDLGCFSLGLKTLTTGQGGFVTANDPSLAARVRGFLSKGSVKVGEEWHPYSRLGAFYPMTDLQAAIGVAQLAKLEDATVAREKTVEILDETFRSLAGFTIPQRLEDGRSVHYLYPFHLDEKTAGVTLKDFVAALQAEGIIDAFGPYLKGKPLYRYPILARAQTYGTSGFPLRDETGITRADYTSLRLPNIERLLPGLGFFHMRNTFIESEAVDIARAVRKVAQYFARNPGAAIPSGTKKPPVTPRSGLGALFGFLRRGKNTES
ncbi:MAG: DegT/DnrJ/EryC1/StrS family aminotransferase [Chthoniobacterales bacterium]